MDAVRLTAAAEPQMGYGSLAAVQPAVPGSGTDTTRFAFELDFLAFHFCSNVTTVVVNVMNVRSVR